MSIILIFLAGTGCRSLTPLEATQKILPRIVQLSIVTAINGSASKSLSIGSGILINKEGYIITANHLLLAGKKYMQQYSNGSPEKMAVIIAPPGMVGNKETIHPTPVNDFSVIDSDEEHDLALLKLETDYLISPKDGSLVPDYHFSNGISGSLVVGGASLTTKIESANDVALSGYLSENLNLYTKTGNVTSSKGESIENAVLTDILDIPIAQNISGIYETSLEPDRNLNGGTIFQIHNGSILGIGISLKKDKNGSDEIALIPSSIIKAVIASHKIVWE